MLYAVSCFLAGALVLLVELAGARGLAPFFGSGLEVWASLLAVTLSALAVGAWVGGAWADRRPKASTLGFAWLGAALFLALELLVRLPLLRALGPWGPQGGALTAGFFLYFPPLFFLAAVGPLTVKMASPDKEHLGRAVGTYSAIGTLGSCFGALATGFVLVPLFPIPRLFAGASFLSALAAVLFLPGRGNRITRTAGLASWGLFLFLMTASPGGGTVKTKVGYLDILDRCDSLYGRVHILGQPKGRYLLLDGILQGGITLPDQVSIAAYSPLMEALGRSAVPGKASVLVVGLGASILPNRFRELGARVEVVDINPKMAAMAEKWFYYRRDPGGDHHADGRVFLDASRGPYDLIFLDAFSGEAAPGQLLTEECFERCRALLSKDGALVLNYVGYASGPESEAPAILGNTLKRAFGEVRLYALGKDGARDNLVFTARAAGAPWGPFPKDVPVDEADRPKFSHLGDFLRPLPSSDRVFTDAWCPVDWIDRRNRLGWRADAWNFLKDSNLLREL